ncbi:MAG: TIGR02679 family protein [Clostridiales bacterium]|jgi:uncharacterized protein (TIGR02679 family)|nr:TIGR02679 family protein [Clostridiales bacterium]
MAATANNLRECVAYFKKTPGFTRVFEALAEKYKSYGHVCGSIELADPEPEEVAALRGFLGRDFTGKRVSVTAAQLEKALKRTRFEGLSFEEVVLAYFGGGLRPARVVRDEAAKEWEGFWSETLPQLEGRAGQWLEIVISHKVPPYALLRKHFNNGQGAVELKKTLLNVSRAMSRLTGQNTQLCRLPILAAQVSRDPHFFDDGTNAGKLLVYGICAMLDETAPTNAEERNELLFRAGIIKDDVSNVCTCYGLSARTKSGGGHDGLEWFAKSGEPVVISLSNLWNIDEVFPAHKSVKNVYILENPTVLTAIADAAKRNYTPAAAVCSGGQFRWAVWMLLDKLGADTVLWYAGDFDPTGLQMADKIKARYGERLRLWRYSPEDYEAALSDVALAPAELAKLRRLAAPELAAIGVLVERYARAGYQEKIVDRYIEDVLEIKAGKLKEYERSKD